MNYREFKQSLDEFIVVPTLAYFIKKFNDRKKAERAMESYNYYIAKGYTVEAAKAQAEKDIQHGVSHYGLK